MKVNGLSLLSAENHLRSEAKGLMDEPRTGLKFGDRAFSISAPRL